MPKTIRKTVPKKSGKLRGGSAAEPPVNEPSEKPTPAVRRTRSRVSKESAVRASGVEEPRAEVSVPEASTPESSAAVAPTLIPPVAPTTNGEERWVELQRSMDGVSEERIASVETAVVNVKRLVAEALRRGFTLSDRDRSALRCLLAAALTQCAARWALLTKAMAYRDRLRTSRHVQTIRAARLDLKGAIAAAKDRGAPADVLEQCERLIH